MTQQPIVYREVFTAGEPFVDSLPEILLNACAKYEQAYGKLPEVCLVDPLRFPEVRGSMDMKITVEGVSTVLRVFTHPSCMVHNVVLGRYR